MKILIILTATLFAFALFPVDAKPVKQQKRAKLVQKVKTPIGVGPKKPSVVKRPPGR